MRFVFINIIVIILIQCSHKPDNRKARAYEIEQRELIYRIKEPFRNEIPDSMKQWIAVFDSVRRRDQRFRSLADPSFYEQHSHEQDLLDSMNQAIVTTFIKTYGYPSKKQIGSIGMAAVSMVIQHSPLVLQIKYYENVKQAYINGQVSGEYFALLEDRINVRNKRLQYYGSQLATVKGKLVPYPVYNIDSIDVYRKQIGMLTTMDGYLKLYFKTDFDINEYKKEVPEMMKTFKITDSPALHYDHH